MLCADLSYSVTVYKQTSLLQTPPKPEDTAADTDGGDSDDDQEEATQVRVM